MNDFIKRFINLIYPQKCIFCGEIIDYDKYCCEKCFEEIHIIGGEICDCCGKEVGKCKGYKKHIYDKAVSTYYYSGKVIHAITQLKFSGNKSSAIFLAEQMYNSYEKYLGDIDFDYIVGVPMHKSKLKKRGYNQANVLANEIGKLAGIKYSENILNKTKDNQIQHSLTANERIQNVKGVYSICNKINVQGLKLLFVDDVLTTGSTLDECAKIVKENGANYVGVLVLSSTL